MVNKMDLQILKEKKYRNLFNTYFFSLVANVGAIAPPPKTGSEIEIGRGLVFSM